MGAIFKHAVSKENLLLFRRRFRALTGNGQHPNVSAYQMKNDTLAFHGRLTPGGLYKIDQVKKTGYSTMGIVVSISPYLETGKNQIHNGHAVALFRSDDTLFYFNAWGDRMKARDHTYKRDKAVMNHFKKLFGSKRVVQYDGPSLQLGNRIGLCVGYAYNFIAEMCLLNHKGKKYLEEIQTPARFNTFIQDKLTSRGLCYGGKCIPSQPGAFKELMGNELMREHINATPRYLGFKNPVALKRFAEKRYGDSFARSLNGLNGEKMEKKIKKKIKEDSAVLRTPVVKKTSMIPSQRNRCQPAKLKAKTAAQLKDELRKRKLPIYGTKQVLQNRLNANNAKIPVPKTIVPSSHKNKSISHLKANLVSRGLSTNCSRQVYQNRLNANTRVKKIVPNAEMKFKQMVKNRMGMKRVTKKAQKTLWAKLSNKNKEQFGTWKPQ
jgi:hypothetical protein